MQKEEESKPKIVEDYEKSGLSQAKYRREPGLNTIKINQSGID